MANKIITMKTKLIFLGILPLVLCLRASAQDYRIDWFRVAGGGGISSGGGYTLEGTIGQHDAGTLSGGGYTLRGGFWGVVGAVQTPGAPSLSVTRTSTNTVVVYWPLPADGWKLHATTSLVTGGGGWTEIPPPYVTNGSNLQFTELAPTGNKFFRLHKP